VFVALVIQHAMRIIHVVICGLAVCNIFFHIILQRQNYLIIEHEMRVLIFSTNFYEIFLILGRTERDMITNVYSLSCKVPVIPVRF
jgi:hypothetical protein